MCDEARGEFSVGVIQMKKLAWISGLALLASGCAPHSSSSSKDLGRNVVRAGDSSVNQTVTEDGQTFQVIAKGALDNQALGPNVVLPGTPAFSQALEKNTGSLGALSAPVAPATTDPTSLVVGLPFSLLSEQYLFDGVITQVSDTANTSLGSLKLTDLTTVHIRMALAKETTGGYHLVLLGCLKNCTEESPLIALQDIPIAGIDTEKNLLLLDLAALGKDLDLMSVLDPEGEELHLKTKYSKTVTFDYSLSTLIFDIESHMLPVAAKDAPATAAVADGAKEEPKETVITRWYLKLSSSFNPAFASRAPTDGVGFSKPSVRPKSASPAFPRPTSVPRLRFTTTSKTSRKSIRPRLPPLLMSGMRPSSPSSARPC